MDELAKKRFDKKADIIGKHLGAFSLGLAAIKKAAPALRSHLYAHIDSVERVSGITPETVAIRNEIRAAWKVYKSKEAMPAVESVIQSFDSVANELAQLAGSLKKE